MVEIKQLDEISRQHLNSIILQSHVLSYLGGIYCNFANSMDPDQTDYEQSDQGS